MKVGIGFIVIGGFFVVSLLWALAQIIFKIDWDKEEFSAKKVLSVLKWTILGFIALVIFIWALNKGMLD